MPHSNHDVSDETLRFHRMVAEGPIQDLRDALKRGIDVNAPGPLGMTALMLALNSKDMEKTQLLIQYGADPELTDDYNATALRNAVEADFVDGVRYLLSLGVDRGYHPRYPLKKIDYDSSMCDITLPEEMRELLSEDEWKASLEETRQAVREMGQNPTVEPMIGSVQSVEVLELFLDAGDDLNLAPTEIKRALVGLDNGMELQVSPSDYIRQKSPRFGTSNPERMDIPFWRDMIRTGGNAYSARTKYQDQEPFRKPGAVWCYDRFGSSLTRLDDGRFVQIGGEHEDFYDPDFVIYNDVVVYEAAGEFEIYGYPRDVFPPTDFHTATLGRDGIYIIGCLGYPDERQPGFTPVYRLTLETWKIESIKTDGEMPGWIHGHRAVYNLARNTIRVTGGEQHVMVNGEPELVPNSYAFELDLSRRNWRR